MEVASVYREPPVLGRKRAFSAVGNTPDTERARKDLLRQRFNAELVAVRGLREKAKKIMAAPPPVKKIKASPPPPVIKRKMVTKGEREQLKADLEKLASDSDLPNHIMELLLKQNHAISDGYFELDMDGVQDEAILELRKQLDKFVGEEEDEYVDIVGGVSPLPIVSVPLLLTEEEDEEYVDICGDTSPVVFLKNLGDDETISGSPCSSSISDSSQAERDATMLMAMAKESIARCKAREKARQDVLETERRRIPSQTIHRELLKNLRIVEYDYERAIPYTLLPQLGLFLKDDDEDQEELLHRHSEEGEILDDLEEGEIQF
jgi:hypothetical protein